MCNISRTIPAKVVLHLVNTFIHVCYFFTYVYTLTKSLLACSFFLVFFTSFGGSFKGFDNYHDCVNKIKRVKGMEHLEENCQIKNINVLNISFVISLIGFLMSIFFHLSDNSNANTYVLFVTEELIVLTIIKY